MRQAEITKRIITALKRASPRGMSRTEISNALGRNILADDIATSINILVDQERVRGEVVYSKTPGRPREIWFAK